MSRSREKPRPEWGTIGRAPRPRLLRRPALGGRAEPGPPLRRRLRHRGDHHRHLLPPELSGAAPRSARNIRFHAVAAAAQAAGFRACKRCRPDATPGSPEWDVRADLVGPGHAAHRRRRGRPRGRAGSRAAARATAAAQVERHAARRARRRAARRWPGRSARRPPGCSSRPPRCRSPTSPSPPGSAASGSSTTPCGRSSPRPPARLRARRCPARAPTPAAGHRSSLRLPFRAAALPRQPLRASRRHGRARGGGVARRRATAARCGCRTGPASSRCRPDAATSAPAAPRPTCATSPAPSPAAAGCSTSTPTRWRSTPRSRADPLLAPLVAAAPGSAGAADRRRARAGTARRPRPAGQHRRGPHPRGPAGARRRATRSRTPRGADPPLPERRGARGSRPGVARAARRAAGATLLAWPRALADGAVDLSPGADRDAARARPRRAAGHRPVDRGERRDARARATRTPSCRTDLGVLVPPAPSVSGTAARWSPAPPPGGPGARTPCSTCGRSATTPSTRSANTRRTTPMTRMPRRPRQPAGAAHRRRRGRRARRPVPGRG